MNEKIYKAMGSSAVSSLVIGICVLATGIAAGVLLIINESGNIYNLNIENQKFYYNTSNPENFFILRVFYSLLSTCLLIIVDISFFPC